MSQDEGIAIETELRGWLKDAEAERDRLAERVKELELENSAYRGALPAANNIADAALAQVSMLREALTETTRMLTGFSTLNEPVVRRALEALAATADAGKWLEQQGSPRRWECKEGKSEG